MLNETFSVIFKHRDAPHFLYLCARGSLLCLQLKNGDMKRHLHFENLGLKRNWDEQSEFPVNLLLFNSTPFDVMQLYLFSLGITHLVQLANQILIENDRYFQEEIPIKILGGVGNNPSKRKFLRFQWTFKCFSVWKSQKKSHSTLRAKRATFTLIKNAKNSQFWRVFENLKLAVK